MRRLCAIAIIVLLSAWPGGQGALAQDATIDPNRDCQTVLTCNYARGGVYRGCLSSYTCRVCRFVSSRCRIHAGQRVCQELRCRWG